MKVSDPQAKQALISRLKRIEGQLRGVQTMIDDERDCREVLQQLASARSALHSASLLFVEQYASNCLLTEAGVQRTEREMLLKELITVLGSAR